MRRAGGALLAAGGAMAIACGALVGAPSSEGPAPGEAGAETGSTSSPDAGYVDASGPIGDGSVDAVAPPIIILCPTGQVFCPANGLCQTACAGCTGYPIACFACDTSQKNPIGTCQPDNANAFCLSGDYSTAYLGGPGKHCDCSDTVVTNCPGANQVCVDAGGTDFCLSCGEPSSNARLCKNGSPCNASSRQCQ